MDIPALLDEYLAGAQKLADAIAGMTDQQLDATPIPGKWSTRQVVCHISDFEPVYADRMKRVLAENGPTLFGGNPDAFAAALAYDQRDVREELELIRIVRQNTARILRTVPPEAFQRIGNHSERGPLTLETLLKSIANHIPHHLAFIAEKRKALGC